MSNEQEFNPLEGWTKEQIKSTLKKHTKTELLKIAIQWRIIAEQLQRQLTDMYSNNDKPIEDDNTRETTPPKTDS
mgnify:CR=1 FL=1